MKADGDNVRNDNNNNNYNTIYLVYYIIWRGDDGAVVVVIVARVNPGRRRCRWPVIVDFPLCTTTTREWRSTISALSHAAAVPFGNNQQQQQQRLRRYRRQRPPCCMAIASDGAYTTDGVSRLRRARCLCRSLSRARGIFGSTQFAGGAARLRVSAAFFFPASSFHAAVLLFSNPAPASPPHRCPAVPCLQCMNRARSTVTLFELTPPSPP